MPTYDYSIQSLYGRSTAYVDYNVSTSHGEKTVGVNSYITITGRAFAKDFAIKSILAYCAFSDGAGLIKRSGVVGTVNKTIAKNTVGTFEIYFTFPKKLWNYLEDYYHNEQGTNLQYVYLDHVFFYLDSTIVGTNFDPTEPHYFPDGEDGENTRTNPTMSYTDDYRVWIKSPDNPAISDVSISDMAPGNPMAVLGVITQNQSQPRMTITSGIDEHHPYMFRDHILTLTGAITGTYTGRTYSVSGSATGSVHFDLPVPTASGVINWSYTITDMFGNTDTETGSFTVYAYSPPVITNLLLERYAIVPDAGGDAHEAADDGTHLWLTLAASIAAVNSLNAWTAVMTYWDAALGESTAVTVTSQDGWTLGGTDGTAISLARDEAQLAGITADDTKDWRFRLTITDALNNSATLVFDGIVKAGAVLDVSPGGVAVGMRCTGTEGGGELFQCAYPARFAAEEITTYTFTKTSGNANVTKIQARRFGCLVSMVITASLTAATSAGSNVIVGTLSGGPLPAIGMTSVASYSGSSVPVLNIGTNGAITVRAIAASYGSNGATAYWTFMFLTSDS